MSKTAKQKASSKKRCWPGYEPVAGKTQHSQGSCRPKAKRSLTTREKRFRNARKGQLRRWSKSHPGSPRKAAQHLHAPRVLTKSRSKPARKKASHEKT